MDLFELEIGNSPLIISAPHSGTYVPEHILFNFTEDGKDLADTDWYVDKLYHSYAKKHDATFLRANYSRYVIDLNRPPNNESLYPGQAKIPLCPDITFKNTPVYRDGLDPDEEEISERIKKYWRPYHNRLAQQIERVVAIHGFALLLDAHSIKRNIPLLFEGDLPDLNIGTANGTSCDDARMQAAAKALEGTDYSHVINGRFIGGYITRHHGNPDQNVHAMQMEICRDLYMDEDGFFYRIERAEKLIAALETMLDAFAHHG
ncbi:MAG: N-formylglutamate deformylase [Pseudomonadota bacterium]|nr:N-formylglutamate deformylase [Pseudomonadota bacterium]MEC9236746.1 N-formylglutamate deformylase [Pseudomonadota bacterium]MED5423343.1 N-formylglutamate deformylase [Pseudomonadota bacterium]